MLSLCNLARPFFSFTVWLKQARGWVAAWEFNTFPQDEYGKTVLPSLHPASSALYNTIRRKKKSIDSPSCRSIITELFLFSCFNTLRPLSIRPGGGRAFVVPCGVLNQAGARLRQKGKLSVYAEVRASETSALRALSCCKKIIALGVEALRQREKTVTFEETGRAERDKSFFHHIRIKQARGLMAARELPQLIINR